MKKSKWILIATFTTLAVISVAGYVLFGWMFYRYQSTDCKERGKAYRLRVERLKRDASMTLRTGTHREDVIRFYQENGLPVSFNNTLSEFEGTIHIKGCSPAGCGSDDALLGLRVKVDSTGAVVGEPVVGALYTDCL